MMQITVVWHDDLKNGDATRKTRIVEVRDRADGSFFKGGVLNQAMRQYGYTEEAIHDQHFVGPVTFTIKKEVS